jgi:hypothetical protein
MGHYWSEMQGDVDPNYEPPAYVKRSPEDKAMYSYGGDPAEGSFTEETVQEEWAVQYHVPDRQAEYKKDEPGDPENWKYRRERQYINGPSEIRDEERVIEHGKTIAKIKGYQSDTRPAQVMRRTITYGPWEVVGRTGETDTGWY